MGANAQQPQQFSQAAPAQGKKSSAPQYGRTATDGSQLAHGSNPGGGYGQVWNTLPPQPGIVGGDVGGTGAQTAQANALRQPLWQRRATQNPQEEATEAAPAAPTNPAGLNQPQSTPATPDTQPGGMQGKVSQLPPQYQQGIQQLMSGMQGKQPRQPPLQFQQNPQTRPAQQPAQSDTAQALRGGSAADRAARMAARRQAMADEEAARRQAMADEEAAKIATGRQTIAEKTATTSQKNPTGKNVDDPKDRDVSQGTNSAGQKYRDMPDGSRQVTVKTPMGEKVHTITAKQRARGIGA